MLKRVLGLFCLLTAAVWAQSANLDVFMATLSTANEVPPIALEASGIAVLWVHTVRDASGQITSGTVDFDVYYNFPGPITLQGLHIHPGAAGVNGGVVIPTDLAAGDRAIVDATGRGVVKRQSNITADNAAGLAALRGLFTNPEGYYVNMHSSVNAGGVIRGQVRRAEWTVLMGPMSPAQEVPPIDINASGFASITAIRSFSPNGAFESGIAEFDIDYRFPEQVTFTGLHIHGAPAGVNGGVLIGTTVGGGANSVLADPSGAGHLSYAVQVTTNAGAIGALHGLFSNPEGYYANLHTTVFGGGVIRAQLKRAEEAQFRVTMSTANEVPPIAGLDAQGIALIDVRLLRDATGAATVGRVLFDVNHRFPGATTFTGLHIHDAKAGENGSVTIGTDLGGGARSVASDSGFGNISRRVHISSGTALASLNLLLMNPENHYANLHTTVNGGGAVRSQLAPARTNNPAIRAVISSVSDPTLRTVGLGGLMTIFGNDLSKVASDIDAVTGDRLPTTANGTSVTIGGKNAPLVVLGNEPGLNPPDYIVAQVPFDTPTGSQPVIVRNSNGASSATNVTVATTAPGIYFDSVGGIVVRATDFSLIRPDNAAAAGDSIAIIVTGLGQTTPALATGQIPPAEGTFLTANPTVTIGGQAATVVGAGAVPGLIGTYAVVVRMPANVPAGRAAVVVRMGDATSNSASIAVR
jgi:uncharacterized protein (TIGR03437 family)